MQGFVNIPYKETEGIDDIVKDLKAKVQKQIDVSKDKRKEDLQGVLSFLDIKEYHYSEGRNAAFDKQNYSVTEIQTASTLPEAMQVKYLLYRYRYDRYPRLGIVPDFPIVMAVEPVSFCNLRCVMCFQVDKTFTGKKSNLGVMDFDLFKKVIDEAAANDLCSLVIASRGEPTLNKNLPKMVAYARQNDILHIKINTNATKLTADYSRELLKAFGNYGVNTLVFSIDSADKEEFERIRVNANFDEIVENIKTFNKIRKEEFPHSNVKTRISMVLVKGYHQDVEKAKGFWPTMVDEFASHEANDRLDIYSHDVNQDEGKRWCSYLFERCYVWFDGTVNPCDEDYKSELALGNAKDMSIKEIWHSPAMQNLRKLHKEKQQCKVFPCDRCYRVMDKWL